MDEDYMFINSYYKHQDKGTYFGNDGNIKINRPLTITQNTPSTTPTSTCSSDEEYIKTELFDGDYFTQLKSSDSMGDVLNISNDFMFSDAQGFDFNQDDIKDLDVSRNTFSPARYFDLFGDAENDDFQFLSNGSSDHIPQKELKHKECKKVEGMQNKIILNGVLNRRTLCPNLPRMKQVGTILRQSASMPGTRLAVSQMKVRKNASPDSGVQSCSENSNTSSNSGHESMGGTYHALEDHRYYARAKRSESPPPLKKRNFNMGSGMQKSNSCSSSSSKNFGPISTKMSILETFLRATCPLDPNKGSDATLATEGMLNLCIREPNAQKKKPMGNVSDKNILRNLLIKEEQEDHEVPPAFSEEDNLMFSSGDPSLIDFPLDPLPFDGFGLDAGLSINDEGIYNIPDFGSYWNDDDSFQMGSLIELEESVRLQDHQDELCVQHYASTFL